MSLFFMNSVTLEMGLINCLKILANRSLNSIKSTNSEQWPIETFKLSFLFSCILKFFASNGFQMEHIRFQNS